LAVFGRKTGIFQKFLAQVRRHRETIPFWVFQVREKPDVQNVCFVTFVCNINILSFFVIFHHFFMFFTDFHLKIDPFLTPFWTDAPILTKHRQKSTRKSS